MRVTWFTLIGARLSRIFKISKLFWKIAKIKGVQPLVLATLKSPFLLKLH